MIKELEKEFIGKGQVKGFKFTQIKKNKYAYIYKVSDGENIHYEVFERKVNTRFNCESKPSNNAFGVWAWTSKDIAKSVSTFIELSELRASKEEEGDK